MPDYYTVQKRQLDQDRKTQYRRRTRWFWYPLVIALLAFIFGLFFPHGCGSSTPNNPSADLDSVTSFGAKTGSTITGIKIFLAPNHYYRFQLTGTLEFPDTDSAESVYVPLLVSERPVRFPKQLHFLASARRSDYQADTTASTEITADIISVASKTGKYFYIAGVLKSDLDSLASSDYHLPKFQIDLQFDAYSDGKDPQLSMPLGNQVQQTTCEVSMDRGSHLSDATLTNSTKSVKFRELPGEISKGYRTYSWSGTAQKNALLSPDLTLTTPTPLIDYFWMALALSLAVAFVFLTIEHRLGQRFGSKLAELKKKVDYHWPENGEDQELARYLSKQHVLYSLEKEHARSRIKRWSIPVLMTLLLLLIFLLISLFGFAQHIHTVVKNLAIEIVPDHSARDSFRLTANFTYEVYSSRPVKQSPDSFHISFARGKNQIDFGKVSYEPPSLNCRNHPRFYFDNVCILDRDYVYIRQPVLDILTNPNADKDEVDKADSLLVGANLCRVKVPFLLYQVQKTAYVSPSLFGFHFHRFPYDEETLTVPLTLEQFATLKSVSVHKDDAFFGSPQINIEGWEMEEEPEAMVLSGDKPVQIRQHQQILVTLHLKRSWMKRLLIPVILLLGIFINVLAWRTRAPILAKIATGVLAQGGLAAIYKLVIEKSDKVPNFLELNDVVTWCDVIFGLGMIIVIFCSLHLPEKQTP